MPRKRVQSDESRPVPAVTPEPSTGNEEELEEREAKRRFREMIWFPLLEEAMRRVLASADGTPEEVSRGLRHVLGSGTPDNRFAAVVSRLAHLLASRKQSVRRASARLLADAFSPLGNPMIQGGSSTPEELEPALPAMLDALIVPDSEVRMSLLQALGHLVLRGCAARILPPLTEHCLQDGSPQVVVAALGMVMAAGIDTASAAVPSVIDLLGHQDAQVRLAACDALTRFGIEAGAAVPLLLGLALADTEDSLRERAALTLAAVDPEGRRTSRELTGPTERQALLSLLRLAGPAEFVFFSRNRPLDRSEKIIWCVEPSPAPPLAIGWGRKQRSFQERYAGSATGRLWAHLLGLGRPINHLLDLVDAVHAGVTGQGSADAPWRSLATRLNRLCGRVDKTASSDLARVQAIGAWLDGYEQDLRRYSTTPDDWEELAARLPKEPGTYGLLLASRAPRSILVGRTGYLGRMVTEVGYYVYIGSALSGVRGRDKHHLTPAEQLKAKWQVDSLRLLCSLEEIWYTVSPVPWECTWARAMMDMSGAQVPAPRKFGATGCWARCETHLPFFARKPSLETFRTRVGKFGQVERLVVSQGE